MKRIVLIGVACCFAFVASGAAAQDKPLFSIPIDVTGRLDPKDRKLVEEALKALNGIPPEARKVLEEHTPILIPRGWYEKQSKQIEDLSRTNAALLARIKVLEGDKLDQMQGAYHWAGKPCGIKILEKAKDGKARLELHFPSGFPRGLADLTLEATYDPALGKVKVYRDKKVVETAWLNYKPGGVHTLVFNESDFFSFGASK